MADEEPSKRSRHLIALRSTIICLIFASGMFALSIPLASAKDLTFFLPGTLICCGTVYWVRCAFPSRQIWVESGASGHRPPFAQRAGVGVGLGVMSACLVVAASLVVWPLQAHMRHEFVPTRILVGGALAGVLVGILVYAFAGILYMRLRGPKARNGHDLPAVIPMLVWFWIQEVIRESVKQLFFDALTSSTQLAVIAGTALAMGWAAYSKCLPELHKPFNWKRDMSLVKRREESET